MKEQKIKLKNTHVQKGITLIALIITIVLMLILATVVVTVSIDGGMFNYAKKAVSVTEFKDIIEQVEVKKIMKDDNKLTGSLIEILGDGYKKYNDILTVVNGKLVYIGNNAEEAGYLLELGLKENQIQSVSLICNVKGHDFVEANYLHPKMCKRCGYTEGEALVASAPHPDQKNSTDIGIGTDGELVNLDNWIYTLKQGTYRLTDGTNNPAYLGEYTSSGEIEGKVPQVINGIDVTDMTNTFRGCTDLKIAPEIPSTIKIMNDTFNRCANLEQVPLIPYGVNSLNNAFRGCTSLISLPDNFTIPETVTGRNMMTTFSGCSNLKNLPDGFRLPTGLTSIHYCFDGCTSLESLPEGFTIPDSVIELTYAFKNCKSLTKLPESFQLPRNTNSKGEYPGMFYGCSNLESLSPNFTIPEGYKDISQCFYGCSSLKSLPDGFTIPSTMKNMTCAFEGCSSLESLPESFNIPEGVTSLNNIFYRCSNLKNVPQGFSVPSTVTDLDSAFRSVPKLEGTITIKGAPAYYGLTFEYSATQGNGLVINYTEDCTNIDEIIATKSSNSNITKGVLVQ